MKNKPKHQTYEVTNHNPWNSKTKTLV